MATKNAKDNYPAAALRHFHDAEILKNVHSYENAFCHYAFSVECAQKTLLYWHNNSTPSKHGIVDDWNDVSLLLQARKTLDSSLACTVPAKTGQRSSSKTISKMFSYKQEGYG